jgi:hypothetical protein
VFGVYRLLRAELVCETSPSAALAFIVFVAVYAAGFVPVVPAPGSIDRGLFRLLVAQAVITCAAYASCLFGAMNVEEFRRWLVAVQADRRSAWVRTPTWVASTALSTISAIVTVTLAADRSAPDVVSIAAVVASAALIVLRDAGLLWLQRLRGGALATDTWATVMLACLHGVVPAILAQTDADWLRAVFSLHPHGGWLGAAVLAAETLLIAWLVRGRLVRYQARVV